MYKMKKRALRAALSLIILTFSLSAFGQIDYVTPREKIIKSLEFNQEGNYAKAQNLLKTFSANDSFYELSGTLLYLTHYQLSEYNEALTVATQFANDLTIKNRESFFKKAGKAAFYGKEYKKGVSALLQGLNSFEDDVNLLDYLGKNYIMLGEDSLAYETCMKGLRINPFHAGVLENLGELNAIQSNYTQAGMAWYLSLFTTFHNSDDYYKQTKTFNLMQKFESIMSGTYERGLFPFNWDGKKESKEDYEDLKIPEPVSSGFIILNYYPEIDQVLQGDVALNARYKTLSKLKYKFAKQSQMMGEMLVKADKPRETQDDYYVYNNLLGNLIAEITKNKVYITHFQQSIISLFDSKYQVKMLKKYTKKALPVNRQITKIMSESMEDMKLPFNGKVQKVSRRFSPYSFNWYAIGDLIIESGTDELENRKGVWEYYYNNGKLESRGRYKLGKKDGAWKEFDKLGVLTEAYEYNNGELNQIREYEKNGVMLEERNIKDLALIDSLLIYYPDGALKKWYYLPKGSKNMGKTAAFHPNGVKQLQADIKNFDYQTGYVYHNDRGIGVFDVKFKNGEKNGPVLENYSDGKLYLNGFYKDNEKDGKWEYFDREGKTSAILNYSKGEQDGKQEYFYHKGKISEIENFNDGEKDGDQLIYQKNGKLESKRVYQDGVLKSIENFDFEGNSIYKKTVKSSTQISPKHPNGTIKSKGKLVDGKKEGKWEFFSEFGVLLSSYEYKDGKMDGKVTKYYKSGVKFSEFFAKDGDYNGKYIGFYANGKKSTEGFYKEGEKVGEWFNFHPDGLIKDKMYFIDGEFYGFQYSYDVKGKLNTSNYMKDEWSYYRVSYDSTERAFDTLHYVTPISSIYYSLNVLGDTTFVSGLKNNEVNGRGVFYPGTKQAYVQNYINGSRDKTWEVKNVLGQVTSIKTYDYGNILTNTFYNPVNGKVTYSAKYKDDDLDGTVSDYYPDGSIKLTSEYKKGSLDGPQVRYAPDGNVVLVLIYDEDDLISYGESKDKQNKADKAVININYSYDNGNPKAIMTIKYGSYDGEWKVFNKSGTVGESRVYKYGYRNGTDSVYDKRGKIMKIIPNIYGETNGAVKVYYAGKLVRKSQYLNDEKQGWEFLYKNGKLIKKVYYYNGDPIIIE